MNDEQGTDQAVGEEQQAERARAALNALCLQLGTAMAEAVQHSPITPRGAMYCAAIALQAFTNGARDIEGWSQQQADGYLAVALADAAVDARNAAPDGDGGST